MRQIKLFLFATPEVLVPWPLFLVVVVSSGILLDDSKFPSSINGDYLHKTFKLITSFSYHQHPSKNVTDRVPFKALNDTNRLLSHVFDRFITTVPEHFSEYCHYLKTNRFTRSGSHVNTIWLFHNFQNKGIIFISIIRMYFLW